MQEALPNANPRSHQTSLTGNRKIYLIILFLILLLGLGVRMIDLTDPPLDFNPTRQLRSAIIARALYYKNSEDIDAQRQEIAISHMNSMERLEPPIFETLVSWTYRLFGSENLAIARVMASMFWLIGAGFLFDLGRRMTSPWAAIVGVAIFLFLPFSIRASRSFQPDPGMVTLIIMTAWALFHWVDKGTLNWAILSGFLGGVAILLKFPAVFFVGGISIGTLLYILGLDGNPQGQDDQKRRMSQLRAIWKAPDVFVMASLMLVPALIYYLLGLPEQNSDPFLHWTIFYRWRDLVSPSFYMRWLVQLDELFGLGLVLAAFIGSLVTKPRIRALLWGFWLGYFLFCLFFPYHTLTHDYYHLTLVALISLSIMPLADLIIRTVNRQGVILQAGLAMVLVLFFSYNIWIARSILVGQDFSDHPAFWQTVGEVIPPDSKAIGLSQDYGMRLMYYGQRKIALWPNNANPEDLAEIADGAEYFVVTAKNQMSPALENFLKSHYAHYAEGPGYVIFDLQNPVEP